MMMRGGLLGDYHIMRPGEDFPSQDIVRGPAAPGDAGLWQEPEDGRHPGEAMKSPIRRVADQRGLFDSDEDLAAFLARMTTPPPPVQGGYEHTFSPSMQARINAEVQPGYRDLRSQTDVPPTISPSIGATLGPLSLSGGLQLQQATNDQGDTKPSEASYYTQVKPTVGAGLKVPLPGDATAEAKFNLTPGELLRLDAEYRRKLLGGDLSLRGSYSQPTGGPPSGSAMLRWGRSF